MRFPQYIWNGVGIGSLEGSGSRSVENNIKEYIDRRESFEDNGTRMVVIYGKGKVFLSIYADVENQKKIAKTLNSFIKD